MAGAGDGEVARREWMQKFIGEGLSAFERMLDRPATGEFCHGDRPTMADLCSCRRSTMHGAGMSIFRRARGSLP